MSLAADIVNTIDLLRRIPQIDIERLSYALSEEEWIEFARELDGLTYFSRCDALWHSDEVNFYGLTVRKRKADACDPERMPIRIQVQREKL